MRHELRTEITIDAAPSEVWRYLTDLAAYHEWNPFITSGAGSTAVGERLTLRMEPPGGRAMTLRPTVTDTDTGRVLEWQGRLGVPGIFDARHRFELNGTDTGTRLVHSEMFRGLLVRPMRRSLDSHTRAGFEAMNAALARRVLGDGAAS
jgi:hypothetical protein